MRMDDTPVQRCRFAHSERKTGFFMYICGMTFGLIRRIKLRVARSLNFLIGNGIGMSLENRLFNSICLISLGIFAFNIPFNYLSGLQTTAFIFVCLALIIGCLYYMARFRNLMWVSISVSAVLVILLFAINYFFSGGVQGATLLSLMLSFVLIIIVSPKKLYGFWVALSLLVAIGLLYIEYYHPDSILVSYADRKALFIDIAFTYVTGIVVSFFSLLYLKQAYNKEKQSADMKALELKQLNDEKLKLFSIISHDLQAPLASLHSYVRLVANDRFNLDERKQVERGLANALHGTQEMLSNLLVWSQSQLSGPHVDLVQHNLQAVLMPVIDIQKIYASQKGITLETNIDDSLEALVDRDMLQLIVRNLINNAIKFTPANGRILVSIARLETKCLITIEDNGTGISSEQQASLFTLRTRSTYGTNNERGIGLGLFLCREYARAQNGEISFDSEYGKGTRFYLSLPLVD